MNFHIAWRRFCFLDRLMLVVIENEAIDSIPHRRKELKVRRIIIKIPLNGFIRINGKLPQTDLNDAPMVFQLQLATPDWNWRINLTRNRALQARGQVRELVVFCQDPGFNSSFSQRQIRQQNSRNSIASAGARMSSTPIAAALTMALTATTDQVVRSTARRRVREVGS